jgi:cellulose synthase operon protein C
MVATAGPGGKAAALTEAKDHLRSASAACESGGVPSGASRAYRKVVRKLTTAAGTLSAKVWGLWQRVAPWVK